MNDRFGFVFEVPASFKMQSAPADDDGRSFVSQNGEVSVLAFGANNVAGATPMSGEKEAIADARAEGGTVTYASLVGRVYIVTGYTRTGDIYYERSAVLTKVAFSLAWTYPRSFKSALDPAVQHSVATFMPGPDRTA